MKEFPKNGWCPNPDNELTDHLSSRFDKNLKYDVGIAWNSNSAWNVITESKYVKYSLNEMDNILFGSNEEDCCGAYFSYKNKEEYNFLISTIESFGIGIEFERDFDFKTPAKVCVIKGNCYKIFNVLDSYINVIKVENIKSYSNGYKKGYESKKTKRDMGAEKSVDRREKSTNIRPSFKTSRIKC